MKGQMSLQAKAERTGPSLALFGVSGIGKPRAGTFKENERALAVKAASALGLTIVELDSAEAREFGTKLPAGRVAANAKGFVPFIRESLFAELTTLAKSQGVEVPTSGPNGGPDDKSSPQHPSKKKGAAPRLPASWDDIEVGDMVLSQDEDPTDGWWQALVEKIDENKITLRWQHAVIKRGPFVKHRYNLALLGPSSEAHDVTSSTFLLAKEDGPIQQWWEATPVKCDGDSVTLKWRDYPNLPAIERAKNMLALVHPDPARALAKKSAKS